MNRKRLRHVLAHLRRGPTEAGYAFFRARRRRRNLADSDVELSASDRLALDPLTDLRPRDVEANARILSEYAALDRLEIATIQWFLPTFHLVTGGGVHTVLRAADHFAREHGATNRFCIYNDPDPVGAERVAARIASAFPALRDAPVTPGGAALEPADAAIATAWTSAFPLVRFQDARAKFFFVQDWEPDFHPAGAARALLEQAASLGIPGLVNTPGLADAWREAGNPAVSFTPAVDTERYHPPQGERDASARARVFFYGRPSQARNAFGLGLAALRAVKERHGDAVEIVCAGEDWSPGQYGMSDVLANRGLLQDLDEVAELYRSCDVGVVFMLTRHPSYQPLEFMASGMATVSNENPHTAWLLRDEENALVSPALPGAVAERIGRLVEDRELRARLAAAGREEVRGLRWEDELERLWGAMTKQGPAFEGGSA